MAINFDHKFVNDYLLVTASGKDESLQQVYEYQKAIVEIAVSNNCKKMLCDERNLIYNISISETYQTAKNPPEQIWKLIKIAIVCSPEFIREAKAMETFVINQGMRFFATDVFTEAENWLCQT